MEGERSGHGGWVGKMHQAATKLGAAAGANVGSGAAGDLEGGDERRGGDVGVPAHHPGAKRPEEQAPELVAVIDRQGPTAADDPVGDAGPREGGPIVGGSAERAAQT